MLPEERIRVLLFIFAVAAVYATGAWFALRMAIQRKWGRAPFRGERALRRAVFALGILGLGCGIYARFVEPYWLEVTRVRIESPRWRGRPLRIVHLSDLHSDAIPRLEERLPAAVRAERPDLIVFTGDAINSPLGLPVWKRCLRELARIAPTLAVRGNWDVWYWKDLDLFGDTHSRELANSSALLTVRDNPVFIAGLTVEQEAAIADVLRPAPADGLRVLLHHYPDQVLEASRLGVDLYLAGHTHGGQVAMPFYGALVTLSRFGKRFESGLHRVGQTWAYVNRGIGMEGGSAPRVRFLARPEVTVIEVFEGEGGAPSLASHGRTL
jgi:predicted MPP superfamily phosphohydrolase